MALHLPNGLVQLVWVQAAKRIGAIYACLPTTLSIKVRTSLLTTPVTRLKAYLSIHTSIHTSLFTPLYSHLHPHLRPHFSPPLPSMYELFYNFLPHLSLQT